MSEKQGDATVDGGFVNRVEFVLKALERESFVAVSHRFKDEDAHGSWLDVALLKHVDDMLVSVHSHHPCQPPG